MNSKQHILIILIIAIIGFVGIFLGIIPDIAPDLANRVPYFRRMATGLKALNKFTPTKIGESQKDAGTLNPGEDGYEEIFDILKSFDPVLEGVESATGYSPDFPDHKVRILGVRDDSLSWGGVSLFEGVWVETEIYIPDKPFYSLNLVCMMPELKDQIKTQKNRFFSRIGFAFAFLALLFEGMYSVFVIVNKPNKISEPKQCNSIDDQN